MVWSSGSLWSEYKFLHQSFVLKAREQKTYLHTACRLQFTVWAEIGRGHCCYWWLLRAFAMETFTLGFLPAGHILSEPSAETRKLLFSFFATNVSPCGVDTFFLLLLLPSSRPLQSLPLSTSSFSLFFPLQFTFLLVSTLTASPGPILPTEGCWCSFKLPGTSQ